MDVPAERSTRTAIGRMALGADPVRGR